ncbi:MAG: hypothetical protein ACI8ZO_000655 [Flavobacteriales bacterium]|jgi:hypothetical protein
MEDGKVDTSVDENSSMSFSNWLNNTRENASKAQVEKVVVKESHPAPIVVEDRIEEPVKEKGLIDKFIEERPRLKPKLESKKSSFFNPIDMAKQSLIEDTELSTETLAKVYLDQELYDKAIQCFEYLKMKNPEKSGLFADRISAIKEQQSIKTK